MKRYTDTERERERERNGTEEKIFEKRCFHRGFKRSDRGRMTDRNRELHLVNITCINC